MQKYGAHPPLSAQLRESLRSDGNFVGGLLILVLTCLSFLFSIVTIAAVKSGFLSPDALSFDDLGLGNTRYLLFYSCVYTVSMGLPTAVCCLLFRRRVTRVFQPHPLTFGSQTATVLMGVGGCIVANVAATVVAGLLQGYGVTLPETPTFLEATPLSLLLNILALALLPAIFEELVFRVCVLGALQKYGGWFAIVVSAALFGLIHGNIVQSVFAFLVGIALGYLTLSTGDVWLAVGIHFANNALSILLEYATLSMDETMRNVTYSVVLYSVGIVGAVVALGCALRRSPVFRKLPLSERPLGAVTAAFVKAPLLLLAGILIVLRIVQFFIG